MGDSTTTAATLILQQNGWFYYQYESKRGLIHVRVTEWYG
jgi:hypothetical protein